MEAIGNEQLLRSEIERLRNEYQACCENWQMEIKERMRLTAELAAATSLLNDVAGTNAKQAMTILRQKGVITSLKNRDNELEVNLRDAEGEVNTTRKQLGKLESQLLHARTARRDELVEKKRELAELRDVLAKERTMAKEVYEGVDKLRPLMYDFKPIGSGESPAKTGDVLQWLREFIEHASCAFQELDATLHVDAGAITAYQMVVSLQKIFDEWRGKVTVAPQQESGKVEDKPEDLRTRSISDVGLGVRVRKAMIRLDVKTIGDLLEKTADDLLECKNIGVTCLNEVREKLKVCHESFKLKGD